MLIDILMKVCSTKCQISNQASTMHCPDHDKIYEQNKSTALGLASTYQAYA